MKRKLIFVFCVLVAATLLVGGAPAVFAQSGGGYDLTWSTIDGGGATFSTGGAYELGGTIGQADAGTMSGGAYGIDGGFWVNLLGYRLYLPLVLK